MIEIKALPLFQGSPQISDQKSDFWNSFTKQTQQFPCSSNTPNKRGQRQGKQKRNNEIDTNKLSCTSHEKQLTTAQKQKEKQKKI